MEEDLEALAAQCRSDAFRQTLAASDVWLRIERTLDDAIGVLRQNVVVVGNTSSDIASAASDGINDREGNDEEDDDDGLGFTIRVSKNQVQNGALDGDFAATSVEVRGDAAEVSKQIAMATSAFRLLRIACVACRPNQSACGATRVIHLAHDFVVGCCHWVDIEDDCLKKSFILLSQVTLQFLVNCVTGNEANQVVVWQLFFPDHFQKVLVECQEHRKIVAFTAALVLNCVNSQDTDDSAVHARRVDLVCARNLVITMLQRCLVKPAITSEAAPTVRSLRINEQQQDPAFEWLCLLFRVLFEANFAKDLYNAVGAHMLSKLWSRVTPEQLILLRMLTMWITSSTSPTKQSRRASGDQARDVAPSNVQGTATTPGAFVSTVFFEFLKHTWVYVITVSDEDRPEEAEEVRKQMWRELENDAKLLLLDMMGEITQDASVIFSDDAELLLVSLLEELQRVWQLRRLGEVPIQAATNAPVARTSSPSDAENVSGRSEPFGYRSGIIRTIGNLCFRHTHHQDIVREQGYLVLFLNHCNIDDANPMVREWSLVALRNLCEGNEANQQYINALKPQSAPSGVVAPSSS